MCVKLSFHKSKAERVMNLSIAEKYIDINEDDRAAQPLKGELDTYNICVIKKFMNQVMNSIELIYNELDSSFKDEKEQFRFEESKGCFGDTYQAFRQLLIHLGQESEYRNELKGCLEKVFHIVIDHQDINKIDDLIEVLKDIMDDCGESENVEFYLYDVYEELLRKQSYFKVMQCEVIGEGAQAKMLLIKKLRRDDVGIAKVISEKTGIAESTALSYLKRSRVPSASFHEFIEATFGCAYSELIVSPDEQIKETVKLASLNIEDYINNAGLEKLVYLQQKSQELKFEYGEIYAQIFVARVKFLLKNDGYQTDIEQAISKSKKIDFQLYTLAITENAFILNSSERCQEAVRKLEIHRKKIKDHEISIDYLGRFYFQLGLGYRRCKDYRRAKRFMVMACDCASTTKIKARRLNNIGLILKNQGKYAEAIQYYRQILKITSNNVEHAIAYNNMVYVHIRLKEYDKAFEMVERAIELVSDVKHINRKIHYYDTLFELILLTDKESGRFIKAFNEIEIDFFHLTKIYDSFKSVIGCVRKMVEIIIKFKDQESMKKLIGIQTEMIEFYNNSKIENDVRLIFADTMLKFIESSMLKEVR